MGALKCCCGVSGGVGDMVQAFISESSKKNFIFIAGFNGKIPQTGGQNGRKNNNH
jgi:hypothetical protein